MLSLDELDLLTAIGIENDLEGLESFLINAQDAYANGNPIINDIVYDKLMNILYKVKPDSIVFKRNWEIEDKQLDDYDEFLKRYPMISIKTVQKLNDARDFIDILYEPKDLIVSMKLNGHAVRVIYSYGRLIGAYTRGRSGKGKDITQHVKMVLPEYIDKLSNVRLLELRGEAVIRLEDFRELSNIFKTPLSVINHLLSPINISPYLDKLRTVFYKVFSSEIEFKEQLREFEYIEEELGFETPLYKLEQKVSCYDFDEFVDKVLNEFGSVDYWYDTDGLVVRLNDNEELIRYGIKGNSYIGTIALKMGEKWESNIYSSIIREIVFQPGKQYLVPKAIIEPVITVTGATVTNVPLYNVGVIERLKLYPGREIYFRFGGETGVTLVLPDGTMIGQLE